MKKIKVIFGLSLALFLSCIMFTSISKAAEGKWVLTKEEHYAWDEGKSKYVSKQNDCYKYTCTIETTDNEVDLIASGGFYHPSDPSQNSTHVVHQVCQIPNSSYKAGDIVTLKVKTYETDVTDWLKGGHSVLEIRYEDKNADGKEHDKFAESSANLINFGTEVPSWSGCWTNVGEEKTVKAQMPDKANNGDRIAIVFKGTASYDSYGSKPSLDYGGTIWYTWIYTYTDKANTDIMIGDDSNNVGKVSGLKVKNKKGCYLYISFKKVSGAKGYQVKYADNKSMKNSTTLFTNKLKGYFINSDGNKVKFKKGTTYYVQVRAYTLDDAGEKVYGKWSATKKVKVKK